jgi:hypothetical protein
LAFHRDGGWSPWAIEEIGVVEVNVENVTLATVNWISGGTQGQYSKVCAFVERRDVRLAVLELQFLDQDSHNDDIVDNGHGDDSDSDYDADNVEYLASQDVVLRLDSWSENDVDYDARLNNADLHNQRRASLGKAESVIVALVVALA